MTPTAKSFISRFDLDDVTESKRLVQADLWRELSRDAGKGGLWSVLLLAGPDVRPEVRMVQENFPDAKVTVIDKDPDRLPSISASGAEFGYVGKLEHLPPATGFAALHVDLCGNLRGVDTRSAISASAELAERYLAVTFTYAFDRHLSMGLSSLQRKADLDGYDIAAVDSLPPVVSDRVLEVYDLLDSADWSLRRVYTYGGSVNHRYPMMTIVFARCGRSRWVPFYVDKLMLPRQTLSLKRHYGPTLLTELCTGKVTPMVKKDEKGRPKAKRFSRIEVTLEKKWGMAALSPEERSKVAKKAAATRKRRAAYRKRAGA